MNILKELLGAEGSLSSGRLPIVAGVALIFLIVPTLIVLWVMGLLPIDYSTLVWLCGILITGGAGSYTAAKMNEKKDEPQQG